MQTFNLERKDVEISWGTYDSVVKTALRFWEWWDSDPDSDRSLSCSPSDALESTLIGYLPEDESAAAIAKLITRATRLITNDRFTNAYKDMFNSVEYERVTGEPLPDIPDHRYIADQETLREFSELISNY